MRAEALDRPLIDHWCRMCGTRFESPHPRHLYCEPCSTSRDLKRKRLTAIKLNHKKLESAGREFGRRVSEGDARKLYEVPKWCDLNWLIKINFPFDWCISKNAIYTLRAKGHVALRREARAYRDGIATLLRSAIRASGVEIVQNKLWLDLFIEKSNHKGDAVNTVDTICDAVKVATGLDDRWFAIRYLDWSVNKHSPHVHLGIGQEDVKPSQICSFCGRLLSFDYFSTNRSRKNGIHRTCRECTAASNRMKPGADE